MRMDPTLITPSAAPFSAFSTAARDYSSTPPSRPRSLARDPITLAGGPRRPSSPASARRTHAFGCDGEAHEATFCATVMWGRVEGDARLQASSSAVSTSDLFVWPSVVG